MNPNHYHGILVALDQALLVFKKAEHELSAEDRQLLLQLEIIRSYVLKAESGHPFALAPLTAALRAAQSSRPQPQPLASSDEGDGAAPEKPARVRVVVADDHDSVRAILRALFAAEGDIDVIAEASNGREAVEIVAAARPDLVMMDLNMPLLDGISATRESLRASPESKVLVFSANRDPAMVQRAAEAGAVGYLYKPATRQMLLSAVREVLAGRTCFPESVVAVAARR
ncbi:MAG: response regulator transcription factor [Verrucomicrobia bacterium]|nr:response regulator transcription factor [Verrucomicrobiota bacterium]